MWQNKVVPGAKRLFNKVTTKDKTSLHSKNEKGTDTTGLVSKTDIAVQNMNALNSLSGNIEVMYDEYLRNMTSEEAQQHLINIVVLTARLAYEIKELSRVVIINNERLSGQYQADVERITQQRVMKSFNSILENNLMLLDEESSEKLSNLLGYQVVVNSSFIPFERMQLKDALEISG